MSSDSPNALTGLEATVGPPLLRKIQESKILVVGAGGIGCELLKNLALSGFREVETIDLDTIDVSNLNRQFLFRSHHVGMPKCQVACEVASQMASTPVQYKAHYGNVCDNTKFNVHFLKKFNLVLNALDNLEARRRVNRLCLAADVPLVEAGTTGYLGQVKVIHKSSDVACYECVTQETQKVYPICTIRSTPSQPVHTIVWAKELYKLLFGEQVEESMLYEDVNGEEKSTYMEAVLKYRQLNGNKDSRKAIALAHEIIVKLYTDEIEKQIGMNRFQTAKKVPTPLDVQEVEKVAGQVKFNMTKKHDTKSVWTVRECLEEFISCLVSSESKSPVFDKDDPLAMRLVTAASNLRSHMFGITPLQSVHDAKGIAGNIIPAIATTNAIVAGLQVLQAIHILRTQLEASSESIKDVCRYMDCNRNKVGASGYYISSSQLDKPNPKCFVCRHSTINLTMNVDQWNLAEFLATIIKKELGFSEPTILLEGDIVYEEGDDADAEMYLVNLPKTLKDLPCGGIHNATIFRIEDFSQDLQVDVCVTHQDVWELAEGETLQDKKYTIGGEAPTAKTNGGVAKLPDAAPEEDDDDSDLEVWDPNQDKKPAAKKRHSEADDAGGPNKKLKTNDDDVIVIDE